MRFVQRRWIPGINSCFVFSYYLLPYVEMWNSKSLTGRGMRCTFSELTKKVTDAQFNSKKLSAQFLPCECNSLKWSYIFVPAIWRGNLYWFGKIKVCVYLWRLHMLSDVVSTLELLVASHLPFQISIVIFTVSSIAYNSSYQVPSSKFQEIISSQAINLSHYYNNFLVCY